MIRHYGKTMPDKHWLARALRRDGREADKTLIANWIWPEDSTAAADVVAYHLPSAGEHSVAISCAALSEHLRQTKDFGEALATACSPAEALIGHGEGWGVTPSAPAAPVQQVRARILAEALECVTKDRAATHGDVEESFGKVAAVWSALLGVPVTPAQVTLLMDALKTVRAWGNPGHADNWVDKAGYSACGGELAASAGEAAA